MCVCVSPNVMFVTIFFGRCCAEVLVIVGKLELVRHRVIKTV